jgi:hypothetical protein
MNNVLNNFIEGIKIDAPLTHKNLTVHFLYGQEDRDLQIRSFDEAIADKSLEVMEIDDGGDVQRLRFINRGPRVLIQAGCIIIGLKQNRTVWSSVIINQNEELVVPVNCIEASRWVHKSRTGHKPRMHLYGELRASNLKRKSQLLKENMVHNSRVSQDEIWDNIDRKMERMGVKSKTNSATDIYDFFKEDIDEYIKAFACPDNAVGFLAMMDTKHVVAMNAYGNHRLFKKQYEDLLSGFAVDATDKDYCEGLKKQKPMNVEQFIESLLRAPQKSYEAIGHGTNILMEGDAIGEALMLDNQVLSMEAFVA